MATNGVIKFRSIVYFGNYQLSRWIQLQHTVLHRSHKPLCSRLRYCTSSHVSSDEVGVTYSNGLPVLSVSLPSRKEQCQFTLRPVSNTLGDFFHYIREEDKGVDRVVAYNTEGLRIAQSTPIDVLLQNDFHLVINEQRYYVKPPQIGLRFSEHTTQLSDLKNTLAQLYSTLNVEQHQLEKENQLLTKLEYLKTELEPFEEIKHQLELKSQKRTTFLKWLGLGLMGFQFGILARLTWWEYSWDIMEPVTYFVTYGTSIIMYAYFVLTKQEYLFPDVRDREFVLTMHRNAKKVKFDIHKYNSLRDSLAETQLDLKRLRDPLQLQLPIQQLQLKKEDQST